MEQIELNEGETKALIKIYIGQRVRSEGLVESSLNSEENTHLTSLKEKQLVEDSYWKSLRHYNLYKTTMKGDEMASTSILQTLYSSELTEEIQRIPLIFLKLCLFDDDTFYNSQSESEFRDFYWNEGVKEFLIEQGLKYRENLIDIFKERGIYIQSYFYVSTRGGELGPIYNMLPEAEIKEFLKTKLGIEKGLSEEIFEKLSDFRQEILKKRENLLFKEIIEDFSPKYAKILELEKEITPVQQEKGFLIFLSYSTKDEGKFAIGKIAERLKTYSDIQDALYWQESVDDNIIEYMDEYVGKCDVFVLFCSLEALESKSIKSEWTAAESANKPIIPVYENREHVPTLLKPRLGLEFDIYEVSKFVEDLHALIIKKVKTAET